MRKKPFSIIMTIALVALLASVAPAAMLSWEGPATGNPTGYLIEVSLDAGATWPFHYTLPATQTTFPLDDKCGFGRSYHFRAYAFNVAGVSAPSNTVSWNRPAYAPPADTSLPAVEQGPTGANLTFVE
ncbi:MAG: fibronectin type III domain-containing protein [Desulfobacterales bacterium]